jgi:hypothetical protein
MNREAERKRLVERLDEMDLFLRNRACAKKSPLNDYDTGIMQEYAKVADEAARMLENAVVPPVKVGQILYVIEAGLIFEAKVKEYKYCSNSVNGIHWHIIFEGLFAMSEAHIGKTVFTSREDALKALEGSGEK